MNPDLEKYIKNLVMNKSSTEINLKIPLVYTFSYKEVYNYISKLVPTKKVNITDTIIGSNTRSYATYDFLVEII